MAPSRTLLCLAALLTPGVGVTGQAYRWVDDAGNVHFSDRPRAAGSEIIELRPAPPPGADPDRAERERKRQRLLDIYQRERQETALEKARAAQRAATREANCGIARRRLQNLLRAPLVYYHDEAGERVYLSDKRRDQAIHEAREALAAWCD